MKIAFLLYEGFTGLDAIGPHEMLCRLPGYEPAFVAKTRDPVTSDSGSLRIVPQYTLDELTNPEIFLVPGGMTGTMPAMQDPVILDWVRKAHETSQWTASVCSGSLILAAAGLLQGLEVTSHFMAKDVLAGFGATYTPERYTFNGKIATSAGVSAGIDMALQLCARIAGDDYAKMMQLSSEYDPQPPFDCGSPAKADADTLEKTIEWCAAIMSGGGS